MRTDEFMGWHHVANARESLIQARDAIERTEVAYVALWEAVKPKEFETWDKRPCLDCTALGGWSYGTGRYTITDDGMAHGEPHHLVCGCLERVVETEGCAYGKPDGTRYCDR